MTPADPNILLVNPDWRELREPGRFRVDVPYFPLELLYIEGALRERHGLASVVADMWGGTLEKKQFQEMLPKADYIVLTTAPTYIFWRDGVCGVDFPREQVAKMRAAAPNARIIVIGPQGTVMPQSLASIDCDYVVRGEAELVVADLIARLAKGEGGAETLPGVCVRQDGEIRIGRGTAVVANLDELPELTFNALSHGKYGQVSYEASRGCPYTCTFCCRDGFRGKLRAKSAARLKAELTALKFHGFNYIAMIDEIFGMNKQWMLEFCRIIEPLKLKWGVQTRTECLSRERLEAMSRAGCVSLEIGLESADPVVSEAVGKKTDYAQLAENVRIACELGLEQVRLFCIFGSPKESLASIAKTKEFLLQFAHLPAVQADVFPMLPLPGTEVWNQAVKLGLPLKDWSDVESHRGIVDNDFKDPAQIDRLCAQFSREWQYLRLRHNLSQSWSGRLALGRMWITVRWPSLIGLRAKLRALARGHSAARYRISS